MNTNTNTPADAAETPAAKWRADGQPDPHGTHYDCERAALALGNLTDDELANAAYLNYDRRPTFQELVNGQGIMPIVYMTAVKDRIRWLSRALEQARAALPAQAVATVADEPEFSTDDADLDTLLEITAQMARGEFVGQDGGMLWMETLEAIKARLAPVQDVAPTDARWTPVISSNPMLNPYPLPNIGDVVLVTVDLYPGTSADIKNRYYTGEARWSEKGWFRVYRDPDVLHGGAQVIGWTSMPAPIGAAAQPAAQPADAQDAARYRFAEQYGWPEYLRQIHPAVEAPTWGYGEGPRFGSIREAIDAARTQGGAA